MIYRALSLLLCLASALPAGAEEPPAAPTTARAPRLGLLQAQVLGAVAGLGLGLALGERPQASFPALRPLRTADAILTGSAGALVLGGKLLYHRPADMTAAEDEPNAFDRKIRRLAVGRRSLENRLLLDHASSGTLMAALFEPVGLLLAAEVPHKWSRDVPVIVEASAITLSVNAFVKHLTHRSRPAAHFCESEHTIVPCPPDTRLSFYSGHTSSAFAAAVAAGTIADFHHLENRKWIWASGLTLATTTGILRVMSDQHYASDVLTGVAAGGLAGWLIPKLHRPDRATPPSAVARSRSSLVTPVYLSVQWRW